MILLKKLIFAPIFLIVFSVLIFQISPLLSSYDFIFSLSINTLISLITLCALISLASFLFVLFAAIASDWKISLPVGLICSAVPFIFIPSALAIVFAVVILVGLLIVNLSLDSTLKSYLTFKPTSLLGPAVKNLTGLLILAFCVIYFLSISKIIPQKGFQIPDSLIDTALKMAPADLSAQSNSMPAQLPTISPEQIELLKKNPDLVRQSGLDPKILDTLSQPRSTKTTQNPTNDLIKQTIKNQVQSTIKPYLSFIPAGLAVLLFFLLSSFVFITNLFISPLLWLTFLILEKTGFAKFETEMREVKKLVV